jgi:hypothetical protein
VRILQTAVPIIGWLDANIGLHCRVPSLRQISNAKLPSQHFKLKVEAQHDVQIVGQLVGVGANQGPRDFIDGTVERGKRNTR